MMFDRRLLTTLALAWFAALSCSAHAQLADKKTLTLDAAKKMAAAAEAEAVKNKWNVVIAVVDDGGHLIYLQRMDGTQTGSIDVAMGKAQNCDGVQAPHQGVRRAGQDASFDRHYWADVVLLEGGVPIKVGEQVIGAMGVSGVTSQQDAQIAEAGIAALETGQ